MLIRSEKLRRVLRVLLPFVLIPALVLLGAVFRGKGYAFLSLCIAVLSFLFFVSGYERRKTGTRRLILVAILTALSVTGRFIPVFKPITAVTMLTAMYLGGESGFLVGSLSAIISNMYFGQGPWTPFQMLSWGLIGLAAGGMAGVLKRSRVALCGFGFIAGIAYSFIMDIWTVLWYNGGFDLSLYRAALVTALPFMLLYGCSNILFLLLLARPIGEKLERVHIKYGV